MQSGAGARFRRGYPAMLEERERELLGGECGGAGRFRVGVSLSGGGVRSATFSFGVLQAMGAAIGRIDVLSTVSGGGYTGSLISRLFTRDAVRNADDVARAIRPGASEADCGDSIRSGAVLGWLRENGYHLAPNGSGDLLLGSAVMLRNLLSVHFVLATLALAGFVFLQILRAWANASPATTAFAWYLEGFFVLQLPLADSLVWWSPWMALALGTLVLFAAPFGVGYWLVTAYVKANCRVCSLAWSALFLVLLGAAAAMSVGSGVAGVESVVEGARLAMESRLDALFAVAVWVVLPLTTCVVVVVVVMEWVRRKPDDGTAAELAVAFRLSVWLKGSLVVFAAMVWIGVVDTAGQSVYLAWGKVGPDLAKVAAAAGAAVVLGALAGRRLVVAWRGHASAVRSRNGSKVLAGLVAGMVLFLALTAVNAVSHAAAWGFQCPDQVRWPSGTESSAIPEVLHCANGVTAERELENILAWGLVLLGLCLVMGRSARFLNDSTLQPLYRSRLARTYLGASNPKRIDEGIPVTQVIEGDDGPLVPKDRKPFEKGAPLHLINETLDGKSRLQRNDRKGIGMAVGPAGISAGIRHHVVFCNGSDKPGEIYPREDEEFSMFRGIENVERLTLGQWTGISGAAFSTGIGSRTSLGYAFLAGLANVRLGYWWYSGVGPRGRKTPHRGSRLGALFTWLFPVQSHLIDEFLGRFHGTGRRRWNLSDGGHFENLGAYELIRRRVQVIVIVDAEADPDYGFEGLGNLVRKARRDFDAEIRFLDTEELEGLRKREEEGEGGSVPCLRYFGGLGDLAPQSPASATAAGGSDARAHAALAEVRYGTEDEAASLIVYMKPSLVGDESVDIAHYSATHPSFPQQTTRDQFFDESQWESYRKLGELIGRRVLGCREDPFAAFLELLRAWNEVRGGKAAMCRGVRAGLCR